MKSAWWFIMRSLNYFLEIFIEDFLISYVDLAFSNWEIRPTKNHKYKIIALFVIKLCDKRHLKEFHKILDNFSVGVWSPHPLQTINRSNRLIYMYNIIWFHAAVSENKCGHRRRMKSAHTSHPPPFRKVTKNDCFIL